MTWKNVLLEQAGGVGVLTLNRPEKLNAFAGEMRRRGARYGLATMCIGVGQGIATILERTDA